MGRNESGRQFFRHYYIFVLVVLASVATATLDFYKAQSEKNLSSLKDKMILFAKLKGEIGRLDEVLTMSARMGAATGDAFWEKRYNEFDPLLEKTINHLLSSFPEMQIAEQTNVANQKLVAMERKSFSLTKETKKNRL